MNEQRVCKKDLFVVYIYITLLLLDVVRNSYLRHIQNNRKEKTHMSRGEEKVLFDEHATRVNDFWHHLLFAHVIN